MVWRLLIFFPFSLLLVKTCEYLSQAAINQHSVSLLLGSAYFSQEKNPLAIVQWAPESKYILFLQIVDDKMFLIYTSTKE